MNTSIFVNILRVIDSYGIEAGLQAAITGSNTLLIEGAGLRHELQIVTLTRPTPGDIERAAGYGHLLVLNQPNMAAREAAQSTNYITLPRGGLRIVLPGLVLIAPEKPQEQHQPTSLRLRGASGRIAESLILHPTQIWNLRDLAKDADVSLGLTQRVVDYLQREDLIMKPDLADAVYRYKRGIGGERGNDTGYENDRSYSAITKKSLHGRLVSNAKELLKRWAQDNHQTGKLFASGYMYSPNPMEAIRRIQSELPGICVGGALAANSYVGRLTNVQPPYMVWIPEAMASSEFLRRTQGFELVNQGANLQFYVIKGDHWRVHAELWEGALRISKPRCYVELYESKGRLQELAEAILESIR